MTVDLFKYLGVPPNAPIEVIERAFRRFAREHHPDVIASKGGDVDLATRHFQEISGAYDTLKRTNKPAVDFEPFHNEATRRYRTKTPEPFSDPNKVTEKDIIDLVNRPIFFTYFKIDQLYTQRPDLIAGTIGVVLEKMDDVGYSLFSHFTTPILDVVVAQVIAGKATLQLIDLKGVTDLRIIEKLSIIPSLVDKTFIIKLCEAYSGSVNRLGNAFSTIYENRPDLIADTAGVALRTIALKKPAHDDPFGFEIVMGSHALQKIIVSQVKAGKATIKSDDLNGITNPDLLGEFSVLPGVITSDHVFGICHAYDDSFNPDSNFNTFKFVQGLGEVYANCPEVVAPTVKTVLAELDKQNKIRFFPKETEKLLDIILAQINAGTIPLTADDISDIKNEDILKKLKQGPLLAPKKEVIETTISPSASDAFPLKPKSVKSGFWRFLGL